MSGPKTTKLGTGRFWVIDVEYLNQRDELVGVESYTGFGYREERRHEPRTCTLDATSHDGDALPELALRRHRDHVVLGALAARDWRPMHHDHDFAVNRNGTQDIFLNTPNQAAWFERYVTDWTGPTGRLGRMKFRMKGSVFPGDTMVMHGTVVGVETDETGCGWVALHRDARRRRRDQDRLLGPGRAARPAPTTTPGRAAATSGDPDRGTDRPMRT